MTEAQEPNQYNYHTFNDFFTRALKSDARPIAADPKNIISPVDGKVWQVGQISATQIITAKSKGFTLEQLLADHTDNETKQLAPLFHSGIFSVLYLAPHNYHRIHMPVDGQLRSMRYVPGNLFSVNPKIAKIMPDLFARNERVITIFDTLIGKVAVIFVGATIVGSIETVWNGVVTPNKLHGISDWQYINQDISFTQGDEIGRFKLGSTVILLCQENAAHWLPELEGQIIQVGQKLGFA